MATKSVEQSSVVATIENLSDFAKDNSEAISESSNAAFAGFASLAKAYQDLTNRNLQKIMNSIKVLTSAKTPTEFFEFQQKLIKEGFEAAVADSRTITELTEQVFAATLEPVKKQVEAFQDVLKKAA